MDISFFNSFKERLVNGEVPNSFYVDCYPIKSNFFEVFNTDEYKIENFRTLDDLNKLNLVGTQFEYTQQPTIAEYCCEYLTESTPVYKDKTINGAPYKVLQTQLYTYTSAQINYRYTPVGSATYKTASASIARGVVVYQPETQKFLIHFLNHPDGGANLQFAENCRNDGTTIWMGYIPDKQAMVNEMCRNSYCPDIYPITGKDFQGLLFADASGNLINYMDFNNPVDFQSGSFVYQFPEVTTINNSGTKTSWATYLALN